MKVLLIESRDRVCTHMAGRVPRDLRSVIDVDDLVQETHVEIFRRIREFTPRGDGSFDRWVTTIAVSRLRNIIKRCRAAKRGGGQRATAYISKRIEDSTIALLDKLAAPGRSPSRCVARTEAIEAVHTALEGLPEHYREAVWLVHIEGQPVRVAAASMGKSERAIHGLCRRGMSLLRDRLQSASRFLTSTG